MHCPIRPRRHGGLYRLDWYDVRRLLRRATPSVIVGLAAMSWFGSGIVAAPAPPDGRPDPTRPGGPPPGHPERLTDEPPRTRAERRLWRSLKDLDR